jgi:hypothetical protein
MADEKELIELSERIAHLSPREHCRLLELVLAAIRQQREDAIAEMLVSQAKLLELKKQQKEANQPIPFPPVTSAHPA